MSEKSEDQQTVTPPDNVGEWKILKKLGKGSFGSVFLAEDMQHKQVAVKMLHSSKCRPARIKFETELHMKFHHPNVVQFIKHFVYPDCTFIVMEYVRGSSLFEVSRRYKSFTEQEAIYLCRQIAQSICYLHSKYIAHGDVKLSNFMLMENGVVKVCDFGLASKAIDRRGQMRQHDAFHGFKSTAAPEVSFARLFVR